MRDPLVETGPNAALPLAERQLQVLEGVLRREPLEGLLAQLCRIVDAESGDSVRAAILLLDAAGTHLVHGAAPSLPEDYSRAVSGLAIDPDRGTCLAAAARNQTVVTPDFTASPGWTGLAELPIAIGLRGAWSMPIRDREGRVLGTFGTYFLQPREPTARERELVATCARTAAVAIERCRDDAIRVAQERRTQFLSMLADATQKLTDAADIMRTSARLLAEFLDVDRCAYASVEDQSVFVITGDHSRNGLPSIVGHWPVTAFGDACDISMRSGVSYVVTDRDRDARLTPQDLEAYCATQIASVICVPLLKDGVFTAAMAVHQATPRAWSFDEITLVERVVSQCWESLERARVTRELQDSEARYRAMVEASPECVKIVARDGSLLQMNASGLRLIEAASADEAVGNSVYRLIAAEDRDAFRKLNEAVCQGRRGELTYGIVGLRGTRRRLETTAVPLPMPDGGFAHLAVTRDVTDRHAADRALAESRARLDYAVRLSGIGFWYCDLPFDGLIWDTRTKAHFWLPPDAVVTIDTFYACIHPDDREPTRVAIERSINTRESYDVHYRTVDPSTGAVKWIRALGGTAYGADGTPIRFDGVTVDVTAQKQDEASFQKLAARQAFQLDLSDHLLPLTWPEAIITTASELIGAHLDACRVVYCEIDDEAGTVQPRYGWTRPGVEVLTGRQMTMDDFGPDLIRDLRAGRSVINRDVTLDPRTAESQEAFAQIGIRSELVVPLLKEGRLAVVLAIHSGVPRDWTDEDMAIVQDVAGRTWLSVDVARAQAELRAERDLSRSIFESMGEGFVLLDGDWTIHYINAIGAELSRRPRAELEGRRLWDILPDLVGSELHRMYESVRRSGESGTVEFAFAPQGEAERWLEARAYPVPGACLAVFFRDVSQRKDAERAAQEMSRRKDEFLAMLAHELRNPLAPIRAAAQLLSMGRLDAGGIAQTSAIIARQVGHMTSLVDDLLDVSRVTRGLVELAREPVRLTDVVSAAVEQVRPLVTARRHRLAVHLAPGIGSVRGDEKRLVQVLANLLTNAAKYTPEGGEIAIRAEEDGEHFVLRVADTGIGMSAELVEQAFDLFSQAERTSDRTLGGLGIGLALVRSLVELHGGSVAAATPGQGLGSEFTVRLPRLLGGGMAPRAQGAASALPDLTGRTVLIVDDNEDAAQTLAMCLRALGCQCMVEHDPLRGLDRARAERPDLCLLDIGLPGMDGNELARQLRADPSTATMRLIAVTGYGQDLDRRKSAQAGFDHHLVKPPELAQLAQLVHAAPRRGS